MTHGFFSQLVFPDCSVSKEGWQQLLEAMQSNPNSDKVRLKHVDISGNPVDEKGLAFLQRHVDMSKELSLQHIDLNGCGATRATLAALFNSLRKSTSIWRSLSVLNLSNNKLDGEALSSVASFLATPNAIKSVSLAGCSVRKLEFQFA